MRWLEWLEYVARLTQSEGDQFTGRAAEMRQAQEAYWRRVIGEQEVDSLRADPELGLARLMSASSSERRIALASALANYHPKDLSVEAHIRRTLDEAVLPADALSIAKIYAQMLARSRLLPMSFALAYLSLRTDFDQSLRSNLYVRAALCYPKWPDKVGMYRAANSNYTMSEEDKLVQTRLVCCYGKPLGPREAAWSTIFSQELCRLVDSFLQDKESAWSEQRNRFEGTPTYNVLHAKEMLRAGKVENAILSISKAIDLDASYGRLYFERALCWHFLGELDKYDRDMASARAAGDYY